MVVNTRCLTVQEIRQPSTSLFFAFTLESKKSGKRGTRVVQTLLTNRLDRAQPSTGGRRVPHAVYAKLRSTTDNMGAGDMHDESSNEHLITSLLVDWSKGDQAAYEQLAPLVYDELHRIARRQMSKERPGHTLQPSALVNEAFLRLIDYDRVNWENRRHFFRLAAKMMREVLINYALSRKSAKRGGAAQRVTLDEALAREKTGAMGLEDLLALN